MSQNDILVRVRGDINDVKAKMGNLKEEISNVHGAAVNMGKGATFPKVPAATQKSLNSTTMVVQNLNFAVQDSAMFATNFRMGLMGVGNNLNMVFQGLSSVRQETGGWGAALRTITSGMMGPMGFIMATSIALTGIQMITAWMGRQKKETEKVTQAQKEYNDAMQGLRKAIDVDQLEASLVTRSKIVTVAKTENAELKQSIQALKDKRTAVANAVRDELYYRENGDKKLRDLDRARIQMQFNSEAVEVARAEQNMAGIDKRIKKERELFEAHKAQTDAELAANQALVAKYDAEIKQKQGVVDINTGIVDQEQKLIKVTQHRIGLIKKAGLWDRAKELKQLRQLAELEASRTQSLDDDIAVRARLRDAMLEEGKTYEGLTTDQKIAYLELQQEINKLVDQKNLQRAKEVATQKRLADQEFEFSIRRAKLNGSTELGILSMRLHRIQDELDAERQGTRQYLDLKQQEKDMELKIDEEKHQEKLDRQKALQNELYNLIRGNGYAQLAIQDRIRAKAAEITAKMILDSEYREQTITTIKTKWEAIRTALQAKAFATKQGFHIKEMLLNAKANVSDTITSGIKLIKSVMAIPFPGNLIAAGAGLAGLFAIISMLKGKAKAVAMKEGAWVDRPTFALLGEDVHTSGPETIVPTRTFKKHMDQDIVPAMIAQVKAQGKVEMTGVENRLERVEKAINSMSGSMQGSFSSALRENHRGSLS